MNSAIFNNSEYGDRKIGQILVDRRLISVSQLSDALIAQQKQNADGKRQFKLGEILLFAEVIQLDDLQSALRSQKLRAQAHRAEAVASQSKQKMKAKMDRELSVKYKTKKKAKSDSFLRKLFSSWKIDS